ncbi:MAG: alpha/beta hydrolase [Thermomicrobiales bacterium]
MKAGFYRMLARLIPGPRAFLSLATATLLMVLPFLGSWAPALAENDIEIRTNLVYRAVGEQKLALDAYLPLPAGGETGSATAVPRAVVVVVHGGGWVGGDKADEHREYISRILAQNGFVAISVNYRLAPDDVYPAAIDDLEAAITWLREPVQVASLDIDPARIGVLGDSSGAQLAGLMGSLGRGPLTEGARVAAVVSLAGPMSFLTDLAQAGGAKSVLGFLGCEEASPCPQRAEASPITYVDASDPPFLLVNGAGDYVVRPEQAILMGEALDKVGVANEILIPPGEAHGSDLFHDQGVVQATIAFLDKYLEQPV